MDEKLTKAAQDVLAERQRQIEVEGWTPEHDDQYEAGELAYGAAAYLLFEQEIADEIWPFDIFMFKPRSVRENLVRAGAMILADIERLDRAEARGIHVPEKVDAMRKRYEFLTSANDCHLDWSITNNKCRVLQWNAAHTAAASITDWHNTPEAAIDEAIRALKNKRRAEGCK